MKSRYILSIEATRDVVEIWRFLRQEAGGGIANRVEAALLEKFGYLSKFPNAGHLRRDLTSLEVRFFPVHTYLIVYRPDTIPLQVVSILHGKRDVAGALRSRLE